MTAGPLDLLGTNPKAPAPVTEGHIRIRDIAEAPKIYDLDAELKLALDNNPRQRQKHASIRGASARTIRSRGRDIYTSDLPLSRLGNVMASGEGLLESDAWLVIDFDYEDITGLIAQPFKIPIEVYGKVSSWTPDALLYRSEQPILVEVKPLGDVHPEDPEKNALAQEWFNAMRKASTDRGAEFLLLTENEIRVEPRFFNAQMMFRAVNAHVPEQLVLKAADALIRLPQLIQVSDLSQHLGEFADSTLLIACLLDRRGYCRLERAHPFSVRSPMANFLGGRS